MYYWPLAAMPWYHYGKYFQDVLDVTRAEGSKESAVYTWEEFDRGDWPSRCGALHTVSRTASCTASHTASHTAPYITHRTVHRTLHRITPYISIQCDCLVPAW